jgi:hypothetical protein
MLILFMMIVGGIIGLIAQVDRYLAGQLVVVLAVILLIVAFAERKSGDRNGPPPK